MPGAISPLPQYAFMAWCSVKTQGLYLFYLYLILLDEDGMSGTWEQEMLTEFCLEILKRILLIFRLEWMNHDGNWSYIIGK
jgi:hypothetical protein